MSDVVIGKRRREDWDSEDRFSARRFVDLEAAVDNEEEDEDEDEDLGKLHFQSLRTCVKY